MFKPTKIAAILVGVLLLGLVVLLAVAKPDPGQTQSTSSLIGLRTPEVKGVSISNESVNIDRWEGSWVIVNFFGTWCVGCVNEHPDLVELDNWGTSRGDVKVVAIVFDDSTDNVAKFFEEQGGDWPVLVDPSIAVDFGVTRIPETFLVDPSGRVALRVQGEVEADSFKKMIEEASNG